VTGTEGAASEARELLLRLMEEDRRIAQRSEDRRLLVAISTLGMTLGAQAVLAATGLSRRSLPLTIGMTAVSVQGAVACLKLHERELFHTARARAFRAELARLNPEARTLDVAAAVERDHGRRHRLARLRLNSVLVAGQAATAALGVAYTLIAGAEPHGRRRRWRIWPGWH
jgi:hypothetical protein